MAFKIVTKSPPIRAPELLVRVPVPVPAPVVAGEEPKMFIPYDQVAPGLYPDESVVALDTGELVAVSVERKRQAGGSSMEFRVWARWIEPDGRTVLDRHGQEVENEFTHVCDIGFFDASKIGDRSAEDEISRELVRIMLGEEPGTKPVIVDEAAHEAAAAALTVELAPGSWSNPEAIEVPIVALSDAVRQQIGIRDAIRMATIAPEAGVSALLRDP